MPAVAPFVLLVGDERLKKLGVSYSFSPLWDAETFVNLKNIAYRSKTSRRDST